MQPQYSTIDMHIHSTASDGVDSPQEIVAKAKEIGLRLISITDHDCIDGVAPGRIAAERAGIGFVSGLEMTVFLYTSMYEDGRKPAELHLLGYGIDETNPLLCTELTENRRYRQWRIDEIVRKVNEVLISDGKVPIELLEIEELQRSVEGAIARPHLARFMVEKGIVPDVQSAFQNYLIKCNIPHRQVLFEQGSQLIRSAGGKVVLAHPGGSANYSLGAIASMGRHWEIIGMLREFIDGLECFHSEHKPEQADDYAKIAQHYGLMITGGSDHHGGPSYGDKLGNVIVPEYVAEQFKQ
ncbi:MAG: PHP domain-containing protein [Candidatus Woesearchaeota archaeon]